MQEESAEILLLESTTRGAIHPRSAQAYIPVSVKSSPSFQIVENRYGPECSIAIALAGTRTRSTLRLMILVAGYSEGDGDKVGSVRSYSYPLIVGE